MLSRVKYYTIYTVSKNRTMFASSFKPRDENACELIFLISLVKSFLCDKVAKMGFSPPSEFILTSEKLRLFGTYVRTSKLKVCNTKHYNELMSIRANLLPYRSLCGEVCLIYVMRNDQMNFSPALTTQNHVLRFTNNGGSKLTSSFY